MQIPRSRARLMPGERAAPQVARRTCHLPLGGLDTSVISAVATTSGQASEFLSKHRYLAWPPGLLSPHVGERHGSER